MGYGEDIEHPRPLQLGLLQERRKEATIRTSLMAELKPPAGSPVTVSDAGSSR